MKDNKKTVKNMYNRTNKETTIKNNRIVSTNDCTITEEKTKEVLSTILIALKKKDDESIEKMVLAYEFLIGVGNSRLKKYFSDNNIQCTFANFLEAIVTLPMKEWLFKKTEKTSFKSLLGEEYLLDGRRLNELIEECMGSYKDLKDEEQNLIRPMLTELRRYRTNKNVQALYTLIRDNLVAKNGDFDFELKRPKSNVWTEEEKTIFNAKLASYEFDFPNTCRFFREDAFKEIYGPTTFEICNNCGLPIKYIDGEYVCINEITCQYNEMVRDLDRRTISVQKGQKVYVVKDGIAFYITRTGIEETLLYNLIKEKYGEKGWKVIKYPGQDADGDILLERDGIIIIIDLKDYVSAKNLELEIKTSSGQYISKDIIYIPQYRKNIYDLNGTLSSLKNVINSTALQNDKGRNPILAYGSTIIKSINKLIEIKMKEGI